MSRRLAFFIDAENLLDESAVDEEVTNPELFSPNIFYNNRPHSHEVRLATEIHIFHQKHDIYHQQVDIYHQQIQEGNLIPNIKNCWDEIAYFQIGDNPGRKEPTTGEINYNKIFEYIYSKGFNGILGIYIKKRMPIFRWP